MAKDHDLLDDVGDDFPDDDLRWLLSDAVADVDPGDGLGAIRRRTAQVPRRTPRRWPLLVLGAGTATAAVIGAVALVGSLGRPGGEDGPADQPAERLDAVATYFLGTTPEGDRLYREFQSVPHTGDGTARALSALRRLETDAGPDDPDYRTAWPDGAFLALDATAEAITVRISEGAAADPAAVAVESIQQVVYTAQAAVGRVVPVTVETAGGTVRTDVVRDGDVLTPVNISDPAEGHTVDDLLTVRGTVRPPTGLDSLPWTLVADGEVALSGEAPVTGGTWEQTTDITDLAPGTYTLVVSLLVGPDDPAVDTRTLTVR
ncbi:hypothetical protein ASE01_11585 [Nocardioides sp. Root190]|uniref:hypothetical protein n=1 Tax=Nocardioides sp. Root190 TaxID=1736488 RepID=UPI0006F76BAA|nr:hypothetical protein [Nocardioides sp. Root190]KRB77357.1 hypothetical protein ASE01_11585 [Nocardioides sp. Root190]